MSWKYTKKINSNLKKPLNQLIEELTNRIYNIINNSSYGNSAIKNAINNVNNNVSNGSVEWVAYASGYLNGTQIKKIYLGNTITNAKKLAVFYNQPLQQNGSGSIDFNWSATNGDDYLSISSGMALFDLIVIQFI